MHARRYALAVAHSELSDDTFNPLCLPQWHHVAATWDGTSSILYERELNLYVDGKLEHPGPFDADGFEGPKTPLINGLGVIKCRSVNKTCISSQRALPYLPVANQCGEANEEGIHIGGIYLCGGAGYAGEYYNGTIDELRIWSRALDLDEITSRMHMPLNSHDQVMCFAGCILFSYRLGSSY